MTTYPGPLVRRITVNIGDVIVSSEPVILQTLLGSCVSACVWDDEVRVGGMNHFMVPKITQETDSSHCGPEAVRRLLKELTAAGADIRRLRAKLFGGGKMLREFTENLDIGKENVRVARELLEEYNIPIVKEFTCTDFGIKVLFCTANGRAFVKKLEQIQDRHD